MEDLYNGSYAFCFRGNRLTETLYAFGDIQVSYFNVPVLDIETERVSEYMVELTKQLTCTSLFRMHGLTEKTDAVLWWFFYKLFVDDKQQNRGIEVNLDTLVRKLVVAYEENQAMHSEQLACINFCLGLGYFFMGTFVHFQDRRGTLCNYLKELCYVLTRLFNQLDIICIRSIRNTKIQSVIKYIRNIYPTEKVNLFCSVEKYDELCSLVQLMSSLLCGCLSCRYKSASPPRNQRRLTFLKHPIFSMPRVPEFDSGVILYTLPKSILCNLFSQKRKDSSIVKPPMLYHIQHEDTLHIKACLDRDFFLSEFYTQRDASSPIIKTGETEGRGQEDTLFKVINNIVFCMYLTCQVKQCLDCEWFLLHSLFFFHLNKLAALIGDSDLKLSLDEIGDQLQRQQLLFGSAFHRFLQILPNLLSHLEIPDKSSSLRANILVEYLLDEKYSLPLDDGLFKKTRNFRQDILNGTRKPFPVRSLFLLSHNFHFDNDAIRYTDGAVFYDNIIPMP